jgi:hypothetical protein
MYGLRKRESSLLTSLEKPAHLERLARLKARGRHPKQLIATAIL